MTKDESTELTGRGETDHRATGVLHISSAAAGHVGSGVARINDSVTRLYVVGPVYGALDGLDALDSLIGLDAAPCRTGETAILHAGGYIDKGNQVPELLDRMAQRHAIGTAPVTYLMGAHEWLMQRALAGDKRAALQWLLSGAEASLDRWQVPATDWIAALPKHIPQQHAAFLAGLFFVASEGSISPYLGLYGKKFLDAEKYFFHDDNKPMKFPDKL